MDTVVPVAEDLIARKQQMQQIIKENLLKAQERMKYYVDLHSSKKESQPGEMVYLKLQSSTSVRRNLKLSSKYMACTRF